MGGLLQEIFFSCYLQGRLMEHNRTKELNENVSIFAYSADLNTFFMYKLVNNYCIDITPEEYSIIEVSEGLFKTTAVMPDEVCIVCTVLNGQAMFLRVGSPDAQYCVYTGLICMSIPYKRITSTGSYISSGQLSEYGSGIYGFKPTNLDYSIIECLGEKVAFDVPYSIGPESAVGTIKLQSNAWQMVAINRKAQVKEYFLDRLEQLTGSDVASLVEVVKAFPSSDDSKNKYQVFVPGVSNPASSSNFNLVTSDNGVDEINPFLVKTKEFSGDIVLDWISNE